MSRKLLAKRQEIGRIYDFIANIYVVNLLFIRLGTISWGLDELGS